MLCPLCQHLLNTIDESLSVMQCSFCRSHFLPLGSIAKLPLSRIKRLDKSNSINLPPSLTCPLCHQTLISFQTSNKKTDLYYVCPQDDGEFYPPQQLLKSKLSINKHSPSRLSLHPFVLVFFLLVFITFVFLSLHTPLTEWFYPKPDATTSLLVSDPLITPISSNQVNISFKTASPATSSISLTGPDDQIQTLTVSSSPQPTHSITLNYLNQAATYSFVLNITDNSQTTLSPRYTFITP